MEGEGEEGRCMDIDVDKGECNSDGREEEAHGVVNRARAPQRCGYYRCEECTLCCAFFFWSKFTRRSDHT